MKHARALAGALLVVAISLDLPEAYGDEFDLANRDTEDDDLDGFGGEVGLENMENVEAFPEKANLIPDAPHVMVEFCTSCNYARNYMALKQYLEKHYLSLRGNIDGGNYPPPFFAQMLATMATYLQVGGMAFLFLGSSIFQTLGYAGPPDWYNQLRENQLQVFMGFFLLSSVAQNLAATGAFEISLNGQRVFSKIESGRMPTIQEIESILEDAGVKKTFNSDAFGDRQI